LTSGGDTAEVWRMDSFQIPQVVINDSPITNIRFMSDESIAATAFDAIRLLDLKTNKLKPIKFPDANVLAMSPSGKFAVTTNKKQAGMYITDISSGQNLTTLGNPVTRVAFSSKETYVGGIGGAKSNTAY